MYEDALYFLDINHQIKSSEWLEYYIICEHNLIIVKEDYR